MISVFFEGLQFYGYHGVSAEERAVGHRYEVDVFLQLSEEPMADEITETVDYASVMGLAQQVGTTRQYQTVEALAAAIADEILKRYELVEEVTIRLSKLLPPAPFIAERAGVELSRARK